MNPNPDHVLTLGLRGRQLEFADGRPFCLVCGADPAGTRRAHFQSTETPAFTRLGGIASGVEAIAHGISFDAPLCAAHLKRAKLNSLLTPILGVAGLVSLGTGIALMPSGMTDARTKVWMGVNLGISAIFFGPMAWFWHKKDRVGLDCDAFRGEDGALHLVYPRLAPGPRAG